VERVQALPSVSGRFEDRITVARQGGAVVETRLIERSIQPAVRSHTQPARMVLEEILSGPNQRVAVTSQLFAM